MVQRRVPFTNVFNFRDLGGYRTAAGARVRWRRLYRADDLSRLEPGEQDRFTALGIRTVVDLRRPNEIEEDGRIPPFDGFTYRHVHLRHARWPERSFADTAERIEYVVARYRDMSVESADGLGEALRHIADADAAPLVFHCIAGKDRTGIVAALALCLLGVPDAAVVADYHLSERAEASAWERYTRVLRPDLRGVVRPYQISPPAAMQRFLDELRVAHGSVANYATSVGVGPDQVAAMRAHLLVR